MSRSRFPGDLLGRGYLLFFTCRATVYSMPASAVARATRSMPSINAAVRRLTFRSRERSHTRTGLWNDPPSLNQLVILAMGAFPYPHKVGAVLDSKRAVIETHSR